MSQSLELALIGNGNVAALIDGRGELAWACMPRIDGDPVFCSLLRERGGDERAAHPHPGRSSSARSRCATSAQAVTRQTPGRASMRFSAAFGISKSRGDESPRPVAWR